MILICTPYSFEKNIGKAYNETMRLLPDDNDWAVMTDIDVLFLDNKTPFQIKRAIEQHPQAGLFTCYASRTGRGQQKFGGMISGDPNVTNHRMIALEQQKQWRLKEITEPVAGYLMAIRKGVWKQIGGFREKGILGTDIDFSRRLMKAGLKIYLIESVYVFHYYRLMEGGVGYTRHLE